MTHKPDDMPDEIPEEGSKMADKKAAAMGKNFASENMSIGANAAIAGAGFGGRIIDSAEHCKDCCCARSWKALGISRYTGKSIPEHITELKSRADRVPIEPGWVTVPKKPTMKTLMRMVDTYAEPKTNAPMYEVYEALLQAAPPAPSDPLVDVLGEALQTAEYGLSQIDPVHFLDSKSEVFTVILNLRSALAQYNARRGK